MKFKKLILRTPQ